MTINTDITFEELLSKPQIADFKDFILSNCRIPDMSWSLKQMQEQFGDWVADSIAYGLSRIFTLIDEGVKVSYNFYDKGECEADPEKKNTKLVYMPGKRNMPFVMICPGGGYGAVCTLKEGFTTAARLNELGYNAFILSYRIKKTEMNERDGILPKPIDDLAAAMRFIEKNANQFGVSLNNYAVAGFSSGGHLAAEWGTDNCGAVRYGIQKPSAVFLAYPASDTAVLHSVDGKNLLLVNMLGENYTEEDVLKYNVNANITDDYPMTYVWHCKDDNIIPIKTSYTMAEELKKHNRPYIFREVVHGGHGFGLGEYSEAKGWLEEAVAFWEKNVRFKGV